MLQLADEHIELVANVSCMLAKHRKSDSVDRKDIQLAYGQSTPLATSMPCLIRVLSFFDSLIVLSES